MSEKKTKIKKMIDMLVLTTQGIWVHVRIFAALEMTVFTLHLSDNLPALRVPTCMYVYVSKYVTQNVSCLNGPVYVYVYDNVSKHNLTPVS